MVCGVCSVRGVCRVPVCWGGAFAACIACAVYAVCSRCKVCVACALWAACAACMGVCGLGSNQMGVTYQ